MSCKKNKNKFGSFKIRFIHFDLFDSNINSNISVLIDNKYLISN